MLKQNIQVIFDHVSNYEIIFETFEKLTIKVSFSEYTEKDKRFCDIIQNLADCWSLNIVRLKNGKHNSLIKDNLLDGEVSEIDFLKIKEIELVLNKNKLDLKENEIYFADLSKLTHKSYLDLPTIDTVYNHFIDVNSVIRFKNIFSNSKLKTKDAQENVKDKYEYRNLIYSSRVSYEKEISNWLNYLAVESLLRYITKQNSEEIILEGNKEISISNNNLYSCELNEKNIESFVKINNHFNESDTNLFEKKNLLIKVMTVYLNDETTFVELIRKIDKIQRDFENSYTNFINNKIESYFNNKNKIIEEIVKTSSKINDENNKMITQILSVLITLLATHFFYLIRFSLISEESFSHLVIGFILFYTLIFYFSNKSSINFYENFIINYFEIVDSVYDLNSDENELKNKFMTPSLKRYKSTFNIILIMLIIMLTIFVYISLGCLGILFELIFGIIFMVIEPKIMSFYKN